MTSAQNCSPSSPFNKNIISPAKTTTQLITPILSKQRQQQKLYHFQNPAKDMSLLRTIALRAPRAPLAATASKQVRFSTSPFQQKDAGSAVKDTIDSVNKTVSDAALKGIEKGEQASATIKSTVGIKAKEAEGSAKEMTGEAKGMTGEVKGMTGEVKGKASEMMGEAKGKTQEMAGQAKGKTQEMAGQAKGKTQEMKGKTQEMAGQAKGKAEEVTEKM